jgi:mannose-6-phosphate isomerase-like protein (cupin superfamily)
MSTATYTTKGTGEGALVRRVLTAAEDTDGCYAVVALTLPPYHPGVALHIHPVHAEGWYVMEGTLAVMQGDHTITLTRGAAVQVMAGVPHSVWNPTAGATTVLVIYTPGVTVAIADALAEGFPIDVLSYQSTASHDA